MTSPPLYPVPSHTSPTLTADSHSSTASSFPITASITSIATSPSDTSPFPPAPDKDHAVPTARSFGAGWKSSSTLTHGMLRNTNEGQQDNSSPEARGDADADDASPTALDALLPPRGAPTGRARSPSLPVLPSHAPHTSHPRNHPIRPVPPALPPAPTHYLPDYELYAPSSAGTLPTSPFDAYPHSYSAYSAYASSPPHSALHHHPSLSSIDIELDDSYPNAQAQAEAQLHALSHGNAHTHAQGYGASKLPRGLSYQQRSPLLHRQSTPNLQGVQRPTLATRGSMRSVRFDVDEGEGMERGEEEDGEPRGLGHGRVPVMGAGVAWGGVRGRLASSTSMPVLPMVGEGRNVFIHRVSTGLTEDELRQIASSFGEVVSVKIPIRTAKPHAFVMFKKPEQAQKFITHLKQRDIDCEYGKEDYQVQNKALEDPNSANMYIAGLPTTLTYDELAELLLPGKICSWKPLVDEAGNRRGPVMARLQTRAQADEVIKKLSGKYYHGMSERLQVRIADSDEQKHFKRHQMRERVPLAMGFDQTRRRASMPADEIGHDVDDLPILLQKQSLLATQLNAINERLTRTSLGPTDTSPPTPTTRLHSVPFPVRPSPIPITNSSFPTDVHCPVISPTSTSWRHRHLSSNVSLSHEPIWGSPARHTAEPWTMDTWSAGPPTMPSMLRRGSIAAGVGSRYAGFGGGYDEMAESWHGHAEVRPGSTGEKGEVGAGGGVGGGGLHHVRSSPELGMRMDGWSFREAMEG
ncbi:hypothetical protein IAT38_005392 [Cryptococcus sp. DSM 104549]